MAAGGGGGGGGGGGERRGRREEQDGGIGGFGWDCVPGPDKRNATRSTESTGNIHCIPRYQVDRHVTVCWSCSSKCIYSYYGYKHFAKGTNTSAIPRKNALYRNVILQS